LPSPRASARPTAPTTVVKREMSTSFLSS
jgi:hypothetical protein